ncbi:MAG: aminopeptidase P family protein [Verrucomicrobia bacterium]|nr:MAG: aminopeptidase P family protein [Verrucomicrobiota bacterium]
MKRDNLLMVADSEHDANMLYALRMFVPDPFIYLRIRGRCHIVMSDLEIDRARKEARHCRVLSWSRYARKLQRDGVHSPGFAAIIRQILREKRLKKIFVPGSFSLGLARELRRLRIKVKIRSGCFFPEREFKHADEVKKISAALMMAEVGLAEGIQALKNAKIGRNSRLLYHNLPLTSEKLRAIIDIAVIQAGGLSANTIVAGGKQGCDPHERGHGVLRAHQPIIIDIFPRSQKTGYFGDITRTVVKGRASEAIRRLYHTVARGQEIAFEKMEAGAPGAEVHDAVRRFFDKEGYKTGKRNGRMQGFFHGTGHGLGLEVHEAPRVGASSKDILRAGHVVTVEPGLYYPEIGGVRLEDVACITPDSPRNLTKFEKLLEV